MAYRFTRILCFLVLVSFLIGCGSVSKGMHWMSYGSPLNNLELDRMVASGTRMKMSWANGETGTITYLTNGTATMDAAGNSTAGTWKIQDSKLCLNWSPNNSSDGQCYSVYRDDEKTLKLFDEQGNHYADISPPGLSS